MSEANTSILASKYLTGVVPGVALVESSETAKDYSGYTVDGNGVLFTVGNNLYITDADLSKLGGIVTASGENVVIGDTTVTGYATLADALAAQNCVMVVDVETSGAGQIEIEGKKVIGSDAIISDSTAANGGGLKTKGAVTLSGVSVVDNSSTSHGGGFYNNGALTADNMYFSGNTANATGAYGGALHINSTQNSIITNSEFVNNSAGRGGAINIDGANTLTVKDSYFAENSVCAEGGAVIVQSASTFEVSGSTFYKNYSPNNAGAIFNYGTLIVDNTLFSENKAGAYCGGAVHNAKNATITGSTFYGNIADGQNSEVADRFITGVGDKKSFSAVTGSSDGQG